MGCVHPKMIVLAGGTFTNTILFACLFVGLLLFPHQKITPGDHGATATSTNSRRAFFEQGAVAVAASLVIVAPSAANAYKVPDLPYAFEALEPYIDAPTMKIHHDKHHATYVANINKATEGQAEKRKFWK